MRAISQLRTGACSDVGLKRRENEDRFLADAEAGIFLVVVGLFWRRTSVMKDFKQRLGDSQQQFRGRLESEFGEIFDRLFYEVRQALTESLFRLDLQASFNAPLLEETFQIGEAASDMVIVSQRMRLTQTPEQPSVAA